MLSREFIVEAPAKFNQYDLHDLRSPNHKQVTQLKSNKHLKDIIETNCSEMLAAYRQTRGVLYRGLGSNKDVVVTNIRPNRTPVQMESTKHIWLEQAFTELGLKANRSNSIFCTTNLEMAKVWGTSPYVIFVRNGWSGTIFEDVKRDYVFNKVAYIDSGYEYMLNAIKNLHPKTIKGSGPLANVLRIKYEDILITGSSYIGINIYNKSILNDVLEFDFKTGLPLTDSAGHSL